MINVTIDGRSFRTEPETWLLQICREHDIPIPTLCYHESIEPGGACRLCMVEITRKDWDGWSTLVTACNYPAKDGLIVRTNSDRVRRMRATVLDLLLARAPNAKIIQDLAREYGITETSYRQDVGRDDCILCGLCTRVCADVIGSAAISTLSRGQYKEIGTPFHEPPPDCIGCASCAHVCPTETIRVEEAHGFRKIWGRTFEMVRCEECGKAFITLEQREKLITKSGLPEVYFNVCDVCKKKTTAKKFVEVVSV